MTPLLENAHKWTLKELKSFLKAPSSNMEDDSFELKEKLPFKKDREGKVRLKKEFCAFANCRGGYIFFGIRDKNRSITGMDYDKEFKHKLSQIITKNIFPATIKWDLPNVIFIRQKEKCVYVVKIEESPYFDKPHMFYDHQEGSAQIPIRRPGGHLDFIKDGKELRDFFLMEDKFYPQYEKHVRYILEKIKNTTNANISLLEIIIFEKFKAYLEKRQVAIYQDREDVGFLLESINRLQDLITRVNRTFSNIGMNTDYGEYIKVKKELDLEIDNFLNNSENIYE